MRSPESVQVLVLPSHSAVSAVFPAVVRDFDDGSKKDILAEMAQGTFTSLGMKALLCFPRCVEERRINMERVADHGASKRAETDLSNQFSFVDGASTGEGVLCRLTG